MAFWDNLTQKASQTTAKAVQKAKDLSEVAKLNSLITSEEGKINNTYSQIGKLYMSLHLQDYEDEFSGMINSIIESEQKIRDYQQQIQDIKGVQKCPNCGAEAVSYTHLIDSGVLQVGPDGVREGIGSHLTDNACVDAHFLAVDGGIHRVASRMGHNRIQGDGVPVKQFPHHGFEQHVAASQSNCNNIQCHKYHPFLIFRRLYNVKATMCT